MVMDDVGVASHNFVTCWADTDIISRQKLDSCYEVHVKIFDYQGLDVGLCFLGHNVCFANYS